jgi:DNA-binding NarL/FixJ family response regulator
VSVSQIGNDKRVTVGVVDDHDMLRESWHLALTTSAPDLKVLGHAKTVQGLRATAAWGADVVLLDLSLGRDQTPIDDNVRWLLESGSRVVIVSATDLPATVRWAFSLGASGYVDKSSGVTCLIEAIRAADSGDEQYMTPALARALDAAPGEYRPNLTPQEARVLSYYAGGMEAKQVARRLDRGLDTVRKHVETIRRKYREAGRPADTRAELYERATQDFYTRDDDTSS